MCLYQPQFNHGNFDERLRFGAIMEKKVVYIHNNVCKETNEQIALKTLFEDTTQTVYWVQYEVATEEEWQYLVENLPLTDAEKLFFNDRKAFPRVEVVGTTGMYLRIPSSNYWEEATHFIHFLLLGNIIISVTRSESKTLDKAALQLSLGEKLEGREGIFFLLYLLENVEEHLVNNYLEARSIISSFISSLENIPQIKDNDKVVEIKGRLASITGQCEEFLFACTLLRNILVVPVYPAATKKMLNDIVDTLTHLEYSMRKLDKCLEDQLHRIDSHLRALSDKRLRILTVLSSIFLPLTFISSLYGMNFEHMPEYSYEYAYPLCLGIMFCITFGMVIYYAIKGWFR